MLKIAVSVASIAQIALASRKNSIKMKKQALSSATFLTVLALFSSTASAKAERLLDYQIFDNTPMDGAYFYSQTESKGKSWVMNLNAHLPARKTPAYTPGSSIELRYKSSPNGTWSAKILHRAIRGQEEWDNGVFIQTKASPFKAPELLQFHMKLATQTKRDSLPKIALLLADNNESISLPLAQYSKQEDTNEWLKVTVPLSEFKGSRISAAEQVKGLIFSQGEESPEEQQLYLDQIDIRSKDSLHMKSTSKVELISSKGFERHIDIAWKPVKDDGICGAVIERAQNGGKFEAIGFRPYWINRYADYVGDKFGKYSYRVRFLSYTDEYSPYSNVLSAETRVLSDDEILDMVQEACARYYFDASEPESGMTLESVPGDPHMIATGASGFGIYSLVVAAHRNFIPREQVAAHLSKILGFLEHADKFHGVFPHYMNGQDAHPVLFFGPDDNGGDLVETSFLMQGLLCARQFFDRDTAQEKSIRDRITHLWEAVEWDWYKQTPDSHYLYWHWSPDKEWKINHRLIGWNESMITYLLAIASPKHPISSNMYYSGFASQEKLAQEYRGNSDGKMYSNGDSYYGLKLDVGGFSGGPIFFTHYNFMGLDPHGLRDKYTDYFQNSKAIAEINLRYCEANPQHHRGYGEDAWGLTASDGPWAYNPDEPRAEGDKGKITPTGAVASIPYLPEQATAAIKNYYRNHGDFLWGEYGFRDAFSLDDHWVNDLYMGLNQGPMVVMIENHRSGLPWKLFGSNPEIKRMRQRVFETK